MTNETSLTVSLITDFDTLQRQANALQKSGYFGVTQAQAITKVLAGAELGLPPFASIAGIHVIQGKPALSSNLVATLIANDPRYSYRVERADDTNCVIQWYEGSDRVGLSSFTIDEAKKAGLSDKATWKAYPSDMLFARAITRGARRFAPGIFGGSPIYTPDELGNVIEGELVTSPDNGPIDEMTDVALDKFDEVAAGLDAEQ